jgi:hypothetical protein
MPSSSILNGDGFPVMNGCGACGEDFGSLGAFDYHRVGSHAYDFTETMRRGRRCLTVAELEKRGWTKDTRGRWRQARNEDAPVRITQSPSVRREPSDKENPSPTPADAEITYPEAA